MNEPDIINKIIESRLTKAIESVNYHEVCTIIDYLCSSQNKDNKIWNEILSLNVKDFFWATVLEKMSGKYPYLRLQLGLLPLSFVEKSLVHIAFIHDLSEDGIRIEPLEFKTKLDIEVEKEKLNILLEKTPTPINVNKV